MDSLTGPFGAGLGPLVQTLLVPALAAALVGYGMRRAVGRAQAGLAAGLALGAAQLAIAWALGGAPALLHPAAIDKLVMACLLFGPLAALLIARQRLEPRAIFGLAAFAPVLWIAWPVLINPDLAVLWRTGLALAAAGIIAAGIARTEGAAQPAVLPITAVGLAGVAFHGATFRMSQLVGGFAVGAMVGPLAVHLAAGWGSAGGLPRVMLTVPFRAAAIAGLASVSAILLLYTTARPSALGMLLLAPLASDLVRQLPRGAGLSQTRHLAATAGLAALAALGAGLWAWLGSAPSLAG